MTERRARPRCRKVIIEQGLRPLANDDGRFTYWALLPNGKKTSISYGLRVEMNKMLEAGELKMVKLPASHFRC